MTNKNLGRLERVELRDIWISEASDFTPWLARKENLDILGQTLGIDLEPEAQERPVGPFLNGTISALNCGTAAS